MLMFSTVKIINNISKCHMIKYTMKLMKEEKKNFKERDAEIMIKDLPININKFQFYIDFEETTINEQKLIYSICN